MRKIILTIVCLNIFIIVCTGQLKTEPVVIGEQFELYSKYNNTNYKISISLPEKYNKDTTRYSCLYLFYGTEPKFHAASGIARAMFDATWQIPKLIIVGVTNMQWDRDLTPIPVEGRKGTGGGKEFLQFVTHDLFAAIDSNYRTTNHRIYMGHSFGGLFGIVAFMENPESFDDFILISPSISQRADYISEAFKEKIKNSKDLKNKFYFSIGSEEARIMRSALWLYEGLEASSQKDIKWKFEMLEGHNHHTLMPISLINGLLFIFDKKQ